MLNTGLRMAEVFGLKWKNVDMGRQTIEVFRSKNNEKRTILINDELLQEIKKIDRHPDSEFIFCNRDGKPYNSMRKSFARAMKIAGVEDFRLHDLRHTFASHLVMSGCDIRAVQQLMGYKTITMTMRCSHLSETHLKNAVNRLGKKLTQNWHKTDSEKAETIKTKSSKSG